jgi:hypothetical protein
MYAITTAIEDTRCAPAIIEEVMIPLSIGLVVRIEYNNATGHPCEGFTPCDKPKPMTVSKGAAVRDISCID